MHATFFAAFRLNLRDSLKAPGRRPEAAMMPLPDDQQNQRRRDIANMTRRLEALDDEEAREIDEIHERYADIKPHTTAAAIVPAITPADAHGSGRRERLRPHWTPPAPLPAEMHPPRGWNS